MGLPAVMDGIVYLLEAGPSDSSGFLDAIDACDGSQRWRIQESSGGFGVLRPAAADEVVYVADSWGIAAFSPSNGAKRGVQQPAVAADPAAANDMVYVGAVSDGGTPIISALSATRGQQQWHLPLTEEQQAAQISDQRRPPLGSATGPVFDAWEVVNGVVVVSYLSTTPTTHSVITILNAETGQPGWSTQGVLLAAG